MRRAGVGLCVACAAVLSAAGAARACADAPRKGETTIPARFSATDAGELRFEDGRPLAPAGVRLPSRLHPDGQVLAASQAVAAGVLAGRSWRVAAAAPHDRHGRVIADAFPSEAGGETLALHLVRAGAGYADPRSSSDCAGVLLQAEREARAAGRGIWAVRSALSRAGDVAELQARRGVFAVVEGRVRAAGQANGRIYLNFGRVWREDATVIFSQGTAATILGDGLVPAMLRGTLVRARGVVREDGGPALLLERAGDLEMVEARTR